MAARRQVFWIVQWYWNPTFCAKSGREDIAATIMKPVLRIARKLVNASRSLKRREWKKSANRSLNLAASTVFAIELDILPIRVLSVPKNFSPPTTNDLKLTSMRDTRKYRSRSKFWKVSISWNGWQKLETIDFEGIDSRFNGLPRYRFFQVVWLLTYLRMSRASCGTDHFSRQFSTRRFGTRENSRTFGDTSVKSKARAWVTINRSFGLESCQQKRWPTGSRERMSWKLWQPGIWIKATEKIQ